MKDAGRKEAEIKMISVERKRNNTGQQAGKKKKINWTEVTATAAWIWLGCVIGFIASSTFFIWAMGWI